MIVPDWRPEGFVNSTAELFTSFLTIYGRNVSAAAPLAMEGRYDEVNVWIDRTEREMRSLAPDALSSPQHTWPQTLWMMRTGEL